MNFKFLFLFSFLIFMNPFFAQPPGIDCGENEDPGPSVCEATPICDLNGYCGRTLPSPVTAWQELADAVCEATETVIWIFTDCMTLQNDSYLMFIANSTTITFDAYVYDCDADPTATKGIQVAFFHTDDCTGGPVEVLYATMLLSEQDDPHEITVTGLIPGETYYILIDGYQEQDCGYTFIAAEGVGLGLAVEVNVGDTMCLGETIIATATGIGDVSYSWTGTGGFTSSDASITVTPSSVGTYTYTVQASGTSSDEAIACPSENDYSFTVVVEDCEIDCDPPIINVENVQDVTCPGDNDGSIEISITGGGTNPTITWTPNVGNGTTVSNLSPGNYTVTVTDSDNCSSTEQITVSVIGDDCDDDCIPPVINVVNVQDASCPGINDGAIEISITGGGTNPTITWSPNVGNGTSLSNLSPGTYTVTVTIDDDCSSSEQITVSVINGDDCDEDCDSPLIDVINVQDASCPGVNDGSIEISTSGGGANHTITWVPNVGNGTTVSNLSPGTYTVTVTDENDCSSSQQITVSVLSEIVVTADVIDTDCSNNSGSITLNVSGGTPDYLYSWTPNVSTSFIASNLGEGNYTVVVTDANGCSTTISSTVEMNGELVEVEIIPGNTTIELGESVDIEVLTDNAVVVDEYIWSYDDGLSCYDCSNPTATPNQTTTYVVTLITDDGCIVQDSITIFVELPCNEMFIPNVFSPNGDGMNDFLCVEGNCIVSLDFAVFNRWGELVFQSYDLTECWDGTFRGKWVQTGVYVYHLTAILKNGEEIKDAGQITVVR